MSEPERLEAAEAEEDLIEHAPILAAIIHWLTGVAFAVILSALLIFVAPHLWNFGQILGEVQEKGVDSSMKVWVANRGPADLALPSGVTGYVFIDVDAAACRAAGLGTRCQDRAPSDPGLVARIARGVLADHPRVVILDVNLWDTDPGQASPTADFAALASAARANPTAPVVAVAPFRPTGAMDAGIFEDSLIPASLAGGAVRFAPAMLWRPSSEPDDVVRSYTPFAAVRSASGALSPTPTLPLLAALYAEAAGTPARIAAVDCRFGPLIGAAPAQCAPPPADPVLQRAQTLAAGDRLVFALPPLVQPTGEAAADAAARFQNHFDRYPASQAFAPNGTALIDPAQLAGKIVIISTSAPTALDFHLTPLGQMSGAELLLNAVCGMLDPHGWIAPPSPGQRAWHEAEIILFASLPFLLFWLGYCQLAHWLGGRRIAGLVVHLYGGIGFVIAVGAAAVLALLITLRSLDEGVANGFSAEFFTPILALSLEGFAEGARWLVDRIESVVDRLVRMMRLPRSAWRKDGGGAP